MFRTKFLEFCTILSREIVQNSRSNRLRIQRRKIDKSWKKKYCDRNFRTFASLAIVYRRNKQVDSSTIIIPDIKVHIFTWSALHSEFAGASVLVARATSSDSFRFIDDTSSRVEDTSWTRYRSKGSRYYCGINNCSLCEISEVVTCYTVSWT